MIILDILTFLITLGIFVLPIYLIVKKVKKGKALNENGTIKEIVKKEKVYDKSFLHN